MMIIGCDFHPSWQQVCWLAEAGTGQWRCGTILPASGDAGADRDGSHGELSLADGSVSRDRSRIVGGRCGPDSSQLCASAEEGQAGCGAYSEAAGGRKVSPHLEKPWAGRRRDDLLKLMAMLDQQIEPLEEAVKAEAQGDKMARLLQTQPGVGPITALAWAMSAAFPAANRWPVIWD